MSRRHDLSRSLVTLDQTSTLIAVIEMSLSSWLVAGVVPGIGRDPLKKIEPDAGELLSLLRRWQQEAEKAGHPIARVTVAYEAGRDGFWLARWLSEHGIECHVIHPVSIAVSREHRRAETDRLDTSLLKRAFLGWLRGEKEHCRMVAVPTVAQEDARCPLREREALVRERTRLINQLKSILIRFGIRDLALARTKSPRRFETWLRDAGHVLPEHERVRFGRSIARLRLLATQIAEIDHGLAEEAKAPGTEADQRVCDLARWRGLGLLTATLLEREVVCRELRDRKAVARYGGITGSPDESGSRRREKGLARAGNAHVRQAMIQFAWRFLSFQKDSGLARWYRQRTENAGPSVRKVMIVALARKLLIALWRFAATGSVPEGVILTAPARG